VHLDQHRHAELPRGILQRFHLRRRQAGGNQEDAVGAHRASLEHLVRIEDEILAQHRQRAGGARCCEVLGRALEELAVGKHRQARRAARGIALRDLRRFELLPHYAFRGACALDLGDHRGTARVDSLSQGGNEVPRWPFPVNTHL